MIQSIINQYKKNKYRALFIGYLITVPIILIFTCCFCYLLLNLYWTSRDTNLANFFETNKVAFEDLRDQKLYTPCGNRSLEANIDGEQFSIYRGCKHDSIVFWGNIGGYRSTYIYTKDEENLQKVPFCSYDGILVGQIDTNWYLCIGDWL